MKVYIDENSHVQIADLLRLTYRSHVFRTFQDEGLSGFYDIPLFEELALRGFNAIITGDFRQMADKDERAAVKAAGLQWIGHQRVQVKRPRGLAMTAGGVLVGIPFVIDHIVGAKGLYAYLIRAVPCRQSERVTIEEL